MKTNEASALQAKKELQELRGTVLSLVEKPRLDEEPVRTSGASGASLVEVDTMLSRITQMTTTISKEDWILNKLSFAEMHDRELFIEDAHVKTFRWLLYDPSDKNPVTDTKDERASNKTQEKEATGLGYGFEGAPKPGSPPSESRPKDGSVLPEISEAPEAPEALKDRPSQLGVKEKENKERKETRLKFLSWLNSGSGLFYISGKVGSGKSTLMKFLSKESRTKQELEKWAGGKRLVFSQFFFWTSGEPVQRSMEGLYRGILWETLRESPDLMRDVFPRCWDAKFNPTNDRLQDRPFAFSDLVAAFELLIRSKKIFDKHKVCFFIDGLDEFDGDHWELAGWLKMWSNAGDLKICVSSRPHNEFIRTFTNLTQHLRLHELTRQDIQNFVQDEFQHDERFLSVCAQNKRYARLVDALIEKADGVFLWVRLATREILSGMGNSYTISQLQEELNQLPEGLEALFRKMLNSIRKPDRMRAARAFLVMTSWLSFRGINRLVIVHAVIDELSDADYDAALLYSTELGSPVTRDDVERMTHSMQDRLNSRCKGLIQISKQTLFQGKELAYLDFVHRSVYEFLAMRDMRADLLEIAGPSFDPGKFMCMAFLRLLKGSYRLAEKNQIAEPEEGSSQSDGWERQVPFGSYFWLLEKLAMPILVTASLTETAASCSCLKELEVASGLLPKLSVCLPAKPAPTAPVLIQKVMFGLTPIEFLSDSNAVAAQGWAWLALCALYGARRFVLDRASQRPDLLGALTRVDLLLLSSVGALCTQPRASPAVNQALVTSLLERGVSPNWPLSNPSRYVPVIPSFPRAMEKRQTTWTAFLWLVATLLQSRQKMPSDSSTEIACMLIGSYLEFGADPTVVFVGYQIVSPEEGPNRRSADRSSEILVGPTYLDLGQLVEMWDPPNKQDLLALWQHKKQQPPRTPWDMGLNLTRSFWQSKTVPRILQIETESLRSSIFLTAAVVSANELPEVDVSDVERWARTTVGRQWLLETKRRWARITGWREWHLETSRGCMDIWSVQI